MSARLFRSAETAGLSSPYESKFRSLYVALNPEQRAAVDAIAGPVMVIAGPGTGKTSVLTLRIANILRRTDTAPDSILALTFTESGAYSMRRKLVEIIGAAAYRVGIFTFHGFANHIIRRHEESFPRIVGSVPATGADQARILEGVFARRRFKFIRPRGDIFYYLPRVLRAIGHLKRENLSPPLFRKILRAERRRIAAAPEHFHEKGRLKGEMKAPVRARLRALEKSRELAEVYRAYEDALARERRFDFDDMLLEALRALERDRELLLTLGEQYQYILADEHQDANSAQNRMLELLTSFDDAPNLFLVGDEKQAIYRFQGASLENFLYFKNKFPRARLLRLTENYRSTQAILDASHSLMEKGRLSQVLPREVLRPRLRAQARGARRNIRFLEFAGAAAEVAFIVGDISKRLKQGIPAREIAVLVRDNEDAFPFAQALEKTDIPLTVFADEDVLRDQELGKLISLLRAAAAPGNEEFFARALHLDFLGVSPVALYALLQHCHLHRLSLFDALRRRTLPPGVRAEAGGRIRSIADDLSRWARLAENASAGEAVETIARESGFMRSLLSSRGSLRALEKLDALFSHLKELSSSRRVFRLSDFLETLERLQRHGLRLSGKSARPEFYDSVSLMTAHRAKGLEFDVIYIVNSVDGRWGGRQSRADFYLPAGAAVTGADSEGDEDERRLFFVALTRARKEAVITSAREGDSGRQKLPSPFVEDIAPEFLTREETSALEKRLRSEAPFYLREKQNAGPSVTEREYLRRVFLEQGLTVTALNNYLSCPWEYFFKNLVRLPQMPEPHLSYGNAMHEALHKFFDRYRGDARIGKRELLRLFVRALQKSPLPLREFEEYGRRGRAALSGYFDARKSGFSRDTFNEFEIAGVLARSNLANTPHVGRRRESGERSGCQLLLRGKLDKIERNQDGTVTVLDYKTGRPHSRAEILGTAMSRGGRRAAGDMKRQLDFYRLLLDSFGEKKFRMRTGVIDFLEPDAKGRYRREEFEMTEKDAARMAEEAIRVAREIYNFEFWSRRCGARRCRFCILADTLSLSSSGRR